MDGARHPTAQKLIDTTVGLIRANGPQSVTIDQVLDTSGISRGSLYHHFGDFPSLVDHALLSIFTELSSATVERLEAVLEETSDPEALRQAIRTMHAALNTPSAAVDRAIRTWVVAHAMIRPTLRAMVAEQQGAVTAAAVRLISAGQARGMIRADLDPLAAAVLVQAYTFGSSLDDVSDVHVDRTRYTALLDEVVDLVIFCNDGRDAAT